MHDIGELNILLRTQIELPVGLKVRINRFREGWNWVTEDVISLGKKIRTHEWNLIKIANGALRSGVGDTSQEAVANALTHALRCVSAHLNAAEVQHIELTHYPWFFLARVRIRPYRIQRSAFLSTLDKAVFVSVAPVSRRLPHHAHMLLSGVMPQLRQILIPSQDVENRAL